MVWFSYCSDRDAESESKKIRRRQLESLEEASITLFFVFHFYHSAVADAWLSERKLEPL